MLATLSADQIEGHLNRHDFSRWLDGVFRDAELAAHIQLLEARVAEADARDVAADIAHAIRVRYQTIAEPWT